MRAPQNGLVRYLAPAAGGSRHRPGVHEVTKPSASGMIVADEHDPGEFRVAVRLGCNFSHRSTSPRS